MSYLSAPSGCGRPDVRGVAFRRGGHEAGYPQVVTTELSQAGGQVADGKRVVRGRRHCPDRTPVLHWPAIDRTEAEALRWRGTIQ